MRSLFLFGKHARLWMIHLAAAHSSKHLNDSKLHLPNGFGLDYCMSTLQNPNAQPFLNIYRELLYETDREMLTRLWALASFDINDALDISHHAPIKHSHALHFCNDIPIP